MDLHDVIEATALKDYQVALRFDDGKTGITDLSSEPSFKGIFAPLQEPAYFEKFTVNPELGTITWPNHADIDPEVLYNLTQPQ
jgi:hypothetical protein